MERLGMKPEQILSANIEARLKILHWDQKDLALKLNTTEASVSRWASGNNYPKKDMIPKIAEASGVSEEWLTTQHSAIPIAPAPETKPPDSMVQVSVTVYNNILMELGAVKADNFKLTQENAELKSQLDSAKKNC